MGVVTRHACHECNALLHLPSRRAGHGDHIGHGVGFLEIEVQQMAGSFWLPFKCRPNGALEQEGERRRQCIYIPFVLGICKQELGFEWQPTLLPGYARLFSKATYIF